MDDFLGSWVDLCSLPRHHELKGGRILGDEDEMQNDECKQHKRKENDDSHYYPIKHHFWQEVAPPSLGPQHTHSNHIHNEMYPRRKDHPNKYFVITFSNAIINPNAVMIELLHASSYPCIYLSHNLQCFDVMRT